MKYNYSSNASFDKEFERLHSAKIISFYPWIGSGYTKTERKSVIIGKCHQTASDGSGKADRNTPEYTREIVFNEAIRKTPTAKIYKDTLKMLFPNEGSNYEFRKRFWEHVAFFNLAKEQGKTLVGKEEFEAFVEIAKIINPEQCLFYGISLSFKNSTTGKTNEELFNDLGVRVIGKKTETFPKGSVFETAILEFNGIFVKAAFCEKFTSGDDFGSYFPVVI